MALVAFTYNHTKRGTLSPQKFLVATNPASWNMLLPKLHKTVLPSARKCLLLVYHVTKDKSVLVHEQDLVAEPNITFSTTEIEFDFRICTIYSKIIEEKQATFSIDSPIINEGEILVALQPNCISKFEVMKNWCKILAVSNKLGIEYRSLGVSFSIHLAAQDPECIVDLILSEKKFELTEPNWSLTSDGQVLTIKHFGCAFVVNHRDIIKL